MKVIENGSDRRAEVHIYADDSPGALREYGEYIDPKDKAICSYVGIEPGSRVWFSGKFSGTTLVIAYDAIIDGILRRSAVYKARSVSVQKNKKLDIDHFLCATTDGVIETMVHVVPLENASVSKGEALETIGTLELRLYVTRQLNVVHQVEHIDAFDDFETDNDERNKRKVTYKEIKQDLRIFFDTDWDPLERAKVKGEQRKMNAPRPGSEPWAIFRFHYRTKNAIERRKMPVTYDSNKKTKTDPHVLSHNPVPELIVGTKGSKDDDDASTRASSPPPDLPLTSDHDPIEEHLSSLRSLCSPSDKAEMTVTDVTGKPAIIDADIAVKNANSIDQDDIVSPDALTKISLTKSYEVPGKSWSENYSKAIEARNDEIEKAASTMKTSTSSMSNVDETRKILEGNAIISGSNTDEDTINVATPEHSSSTQLDTEKAFKLNNGPTQENVILVKKRPSPLANVTTLEKFKRTKLNTCLLTPSSVLEKSPIISSSLVLKPSSVERQLVDQRKRLEEIRKKREQTAKKQALLEEKLVPYKQRMAEELDRLNKEMLEEEAAYEDDKQHYKTSLEMLKEFESRNGD